MTAIMRDRVDNMVEVEAVEKPTSLLEMVVMVGLELFGDLIDIIQTQILLTYSINN